MRRDRAETQSRRPTFHFSCESSMKFLSTGNSRLPLDNGLYPLPFLGADRLNAGTAV